MALHIYNIYARSFQVREYVTQVHEDIERVLSILMWISSMPVGSDCCLPTGDLGRSPHRKNNDERDHDVDARYHDGDDCQVVCYPSRDGHLAILVVIR